MFEGRYFSNFMGFNAFRIYLFFIYNMEQSAKEDSPLPYLLITVLPA